MSDNVELKYKRVGEGYDGFIYIPDANVTGAKFEFPFTGYSFAAMMSQVHHFLTRTVADTGLLITRTDREGLLPAQLEPKLLHLLRTDPVAYIKANTTPDRVLDLRGARRMSKLAESDAHVVPKSTGLRHGLDTLADAFGEVLYTKAKASRAGQAETTHWIYEHPATGRWSDLRTIEHWLDSHATEVQPLDSTGGWLLINVELLLKTNAERFYYPREWNDFGSWITKEQLQTKLEQFRKDKANVTR